MTMLLKYLLKNVSFFIHPPSYNLSNIDNWTPDNVFTKLNDFTHWFILLQITLEKVTHIGV